MIDWSVDQSLYKSIPNPGIQENEVIDYRGVDVSTNYRKSMSFDYDVIFYYIGHRISTELEHFYANYGFIVTSTAGSRTGKIPVYKFFKIRLLKRRFGMRRR